LRLIEIRGIPNGDGSYLLVHEYLTEKKKEPRTVVITEATNTPIVASLVYVSSKRMCPSVVKLFVGGDEHTLRLRTNGTLMSQMLNGKPLNELTQRTGQGRHSLK
jgi:hypothetical protein